jgi:preprotein translocase subunit SecF
MLRIFHNTNYDFIKWWKVAAALTIAFIVVGLSTYAFKGGVNYSIEFTSGTMMQLAFKKPPDVEAIRSTLDAAGIVGAEIQKFGSDTDYTVRAQDRPKAGATTGGAETVARQIEGALTKKFGAGTFRVVRTAAVGPRVGNELRRGATIAMLLGGLVTLIYLAIRFEWRFGVAAVLSTTHDVLVTLAYIKLMNIEVSLTVIAAILTLLGYSGNDTIIIFDRVRENLKKDRRTPLRDLLNRSINETLPRSILTHTTTLTATLALLLFAGEVLRPFAEVMTFGIFVATFSSIYVASPILLWIERKYPRKTNDKAGVTARMARAESTAGDTPRPPRSRPPQKATTR